MEVAFRTDTIYFRAQAQESRLDLLSLSMDTPHPATALLQNDYIYNFEVDDKDIYYATLDQIRAIPRSGGAPSTLYENTAKTGSIGGPVLDNDWVYLTYGGAILRVPKSGGNAVTIASNELPGHLRVDEQYVYWVNTFPYGGNAPLSLRRAAKQGGGSSETLATDDGIVDGEANLRFAIDHLHVYWADRKNHRIVRYPKWGDPTVILAQGADAGWVVSLVVIGNYVYFIEGLGDTRALRRVSTAGGAVEQLATLEGSAYALAWAPDAYFGDPIFYYTTYFANPGAVKRVTCSWQN
jgi:hypothetical protein